MDSDGLALLSMISGLAVIASFAGLIWAAIQDGRDEARFRARRPH